MKCPFCGTLNSRVIDSRSADDGNSIRRRRECTACGKRFTTYETVEKIPLIVIKNDGRRIAFDRNKLLTGIIRSCYKRDISTQKVIEFADNIEKDLRNMMVSEISSKKIGELIMDRLKYFDEVAYIRFASVYRKFTDVNNFAQEMEELRSTKEHRK